MQDGLNTLKAVTLGSTVAITGAASLSSTLLVSGAATMSATLAITGTTTHSQQISVALGTDATTFALSAAGSTPATIGSIVGSTAYTGWIRVTIAGTLRYIPFFA